AGLHGLAIPPWRRVPGVLLLPVLPLGPRLGHLVPRVIGRERVARGIRREALALSAAGPLFVVRVFHELLDANVQLVQIRGDQLAVDDDTRRSPATIAPG